MLLIFATNPPKKGWSTCRYSAQIHCAAQDPTTYMKQYGAIVLNEHSKGEYIMSAQ